MWLLLLGVNWTERKNYIRGTVQLFGGKVRGKFEVVCADSGYYGGPKISSRLQLQKTLPNRKNALKKQNKTNQQQQQQ